MVFPQDIRKLHPATVTEESGSIIPSIFEYKLTSCHIGLSQRSSRKKLFVTFLASRSTGNPNSVGISGGNSGGNNVAILTQQRVLILFQCSSHHIVEIVWRCMAFMHTVRERKIEMLPQESGRGGAQNQIHVFVSSPLTFSLWLQYFVPGKMFLRKIMPLLLKLHPFGIHCQTISDIWR